MKSTPSQYLYLMYSKRKHCWRMSYNNLDNLGRMIFPNSFLGISSMKRTPARSFSSSMTSPSKKNQLQFIAVTLGDCLSKYRWCNRRVLQQLQWHLFLKPQKPRAVHRPLRGADRRLRLLPQLDGSSFAFQCWSEPPVCHN